MTEPQAPPTESPGKPHVHVVPLPILLAVFAALIVLTWITVAATRIDLGSWNLVIAMAIATVKATLVALYFMHLRYDKPFYSLLFVTAVLFVGIFISLTLMDTLEYQPDTDPWDETAAVWRQPCEPHA